MQKIESLGQLAGGVAHDFNNILGIIRGYGHVLSKRLGTDEKLTEPMMHILNAVDRGANLADKLLTFTRKKINEDDAVTMHELITAATSMLTPLLGGQITLETQAPRENVKIFCKSDYMIQILMNLVINARDAMPSGGIIKILCNLVPGTAAINEWPKAKNTEHYIKIQVIDQGKGIPPDIQARIFEPFFTTKDVGKGTGLGLSIVYGLLQQHHGDILVTSTLGVGTMFTLYVPAIKTNTPQINAPLQTDINLSDLTGKTVIIVDDEPGMRLSLAEYLSDLGMRVHLAASGDQALCLQDEMPDPIDLLISDVRMPVMNGFHLANLWHEIRQDCPVILMSGYSDHKDEATQAEHAAFIRKPINYDELIIMIKQVLKS
jgi:CheY-like chemotaxis protein